MHIDSVFSAAEMQLVTFAVGEEIFGIDIMNVQEIIRIPDLIRIPQSPPYVRGVSSLRGSILPIIDTRAKFGMTSQDVNSSSRVIVVNVDGKLAGLNVDSVSEIMRVDGRSIESAPAGFGVDLDNNPITGVVKCEGTRKLVMILDAASLCNVQAGASVQVEAADKLNKAQIQEEIKIVSFLVGEEEYGLDLGAVREIIRFPPIVKMPNAPPYIKGIISLRNSLMPIIDLRTKLGAGSDRVDTGTRVIIVDLNGIDIGVTVDQVFEVIRLGCETVFPPPQVFDKQIGEKITGIARLDNGKRIIMLLDLQDIINPSLVENLKNEAAQLIGEDEDIELHQKLESDEQMVVFRLAGEQFGVRISQIQEITKLAKITRVPRSPEFVEGVFNLRGDLIPVVNLRRRFAIPAGKHTDRTRIMVAELNQNKAGIIVDEVLEVLQAPPGCLEAMPLVVSENKDRAFFNGIVKIGERLIMSLDLNNILAEEQWQQLKKVAKQSAAPKPHTKSAKKQSSL